MKVLKFGGTSVGNAQNIRQVAQIATTSERSIIVLSAMAGATDKLVAIADCLKEGKSAVALEKMNNLVFNFLDLSSQLLTKDTSKQEFNNFIIDIIVKVKSTFKYVYSESIRGQIISIGEMITSQLFSCYLHEIGVAHKLIWADNFMRIDADRDPIYPAIKNRLEQLITDDTNLYITQGFICRNSLSHIDTFTRGGSDYSATIIGAVIEADEVQIWTDIDGIHNNDPRFVSGTSPLSNLSFEEAEELAYFGAKILHPMCIEPVKRKSIPVIIKNTLNPLAAGTLISGDAEIKSVKAIAAKDGIISIKIKSAKMMQAYGFLRRIFEIFDLYKTSVDMVTTSEVTVSVTIENTEYLNEIIEQLNHLGSVEISSNQTLICIVGNLVDCGINTILGSTNIPIEMISYGSNSSNIVLLIKSEYKRQALQELNNHLFTEHNVYRATADEVLSN